MKRFLALILVLCTCVAVLSSCASCADEEENVEVPTAETEPKKFADAKLASKIKAGMTREEIRKMLGVTPIKYDDKYERVDVYIFDDGRAAYIEYSKNDVESLKNIKLEETVDSALVDQIKEGYSYDKITEIFGGVKGEMTTSRYWGIYRYVLRDGRLLYIDYDDLKFATSISIESEGGEVIYPHRQPQKAFTCDDLDSLNQHLATSYKGMKIAIPTLVSDEYKFGKALDTKACFSYSFGPAAYSMDDEEYYDSEFRIEVSKIDILYEDMVDYYDNEDRNELIECREGVTFVKNWGRFLFDNDGRVITVDIPMNLRAEKNHHRDENSPPPITTLEELEKYLVIEYLDLSDVGAVE